MNPEQIRVVLVETQGDANLGAVARTMACFGVKELYLVRPKARVRDTANFWAVHGKETLETRVVVDTLVEAIADCTLAIGTSGIEGKRRYRMVTPAQLSEEVLPMFDPGKMALVFGNEESGLNGADLELCQRLVKFPTQPEHFSVNLAHSVTIMLYELVGRVAGTELGGRPKQLSSPQQRQRMLQEWAKFMGERGYPKHVATLDLELRKLGDIVERSRLEQWEVRFLLGMLRHLRKWEMGYLKTGIER